MFYPNFREKGVGLVAVSWTCLVVFCAAVTAPCDKSRRVFIEQNGIITDGPSSSNYTQVIKYQNQYIYIYIYKYFYEKN